MENYINSTGESSITHYKIGDEYIVVKYKNKTVEYRVSNNSQENIDRMKELARKGTGLSRYISKHKVKETNIDENKSIYQRLKAFF